ncbi:MAG: chromosomal replication initiator protein DnaA [Hirschia sp.]|nr:chromosomal replication initiator protein DnaA [Hirschia sp.]MBF18797.1 chromosomal replication initiator protein DnaA [Hirschia sp.]
MKTHGSIGLKAGFTSGVASEMDFAADTDVETGGPALWLQVRTIVRQQIGAESFEKWIASIVFVAEVDGEILLAAGSSVECDRVNRDYKRVIEAVWRRLDPRKRYIRVVAINDLDSSMRELANASVAALHRATSQIKLVADATEVEVEDSSDSEELDGDDGYAQSFETLVVGDSNRLAVGVAKKLANDLAGPVSVILFYGDHGVGKTHVMRAIQQEKSRRTGKASVVYMSAEEFMLTFMEGVKNRDTSDQRKRIRKASVVLLDDLQLILSRKGTLNEFFSHLRFVTDHGGKVVLSADAAPTRLQCLDSRMSDEIKGGVVVEIERPNLEERAAIVRSKVEIIAREFPEFHLTEEWVDMIADRLPASGRALYGAVRNVFAGTALIDEPVTEAAVETAIRLQVGERRAPKLETVKDVVAKHYGLTKADLESPTRRQTLVRPRQIAMYLCRTLTTCSFPQIGWAFGKRDHTTVMYGYRKVKKLIAKDRVYAEEVAMVERLIMEGPRTGDEA